MAVSYAPGVSVCGRMIVAPSRIRSRSRPSMLKRRRNANVGAFLVRLYELKAQRGGEVEARGGRREVREQFQLVESSTGRLTDS